MKLVAFNGSGGEAIGIVGADGRILHLAEIGFDAVRDVQGVIEAGPSMLGMISSLLAAAKPDDPAWRDPSAVQLLAPIPRPQRNIFCVGRNYKLHIEESARARGHDPSYPQVPELFTKPTSAVIGTGAGIQRHASLTGKVDYEVELGIVIGRGGRDIPFHEALGAVFGYTIVNDISARDLQVAHGQWFKGKALDSFCPIGPCIVTADEFGDVAGHRISLSVNGTLRQDSDTSDMLFDAAMIIESLSAGLTLQPGDIIATGTPSGVAFGMSPQAYLEVGDIVEAEIEGIGLLRNMVVSG